MRATAFGLEALGRSIARRSSSTGKVIDNASSKNIFNSKNLNEGEDERVREWGNQDKKTIPIPERKPQTPMNREVSSWSEEDVEEIMKTKAYQFDNSTQKKVQSYFDYNYPGNVEYDATGRMLPAKKRRPFL